MRYCCVAWAFVWYSEALIINAWSAIHGTRKTAFLVVFGGAVLFLKK